MNPLAILTAQTEAIEKPTDDALRQWLHHHSADVAVRVCRSKAQEKMAAVVCDAVAANDGNSKIDGANAKLADAKRYQTFIEVLRELREQPPSKPFTITRLI